MTPRLLDLFAGGGGCSVGYARTGFDVVGVDLLPHPDYPYELIVDDVFTILGDRRFLDRFDVISASPPCQGYSTMTADPLKHPRLIAPVRACLRLWGGAYVIENVEGARRFMDHPVKVCGSSLGLRVRRHRYFESNRFLIGTPCMHNIVPRPVGVYGDHGTGYEEPLRPDGTRRGRKAADADDARDALGIDWMTSWDDLTDAIPPAYTQHLGAQLLDVLAVPA